MDIHKNARLTPHSRADLVRRVVVEGQSQIVVAAAFGVCIETVRKWVRRFREEGEAGLMDRSSRPHRLRNPTPELIAGRVAALRPIVDRLSSRPRLVFTTHAHVDHVGSHPEFADCEILAHPAEADEPLKVSPGYCSLKLTKSFSPREK